MSNIVAIKNADKTVSLVGKQGSTWELFLFLHVPPDNMPMNLTGFTFAGQIRANYTAQEKTDFQCSIVNALEGKMSVFASAATTAAINAYKESIDIRKLNTCKGTGVYVYDIEMTDTVGKVSRIVEGLLYVDPEATK